MKDKVVNVKKHLSDVEIENRIREVVGLWRVKRWQIIKHAMLSPCPAKTLSLIYGMSIGGVNNLISQYNKVGIKAIDTVGKGRRQRAYMPHDKEKDFLSPFVEKAKKGLITTTAEIKKALEDFVGHKIHKTTIYRLLDRHNWRKIAPRPIHPKSNKLEQEDFKKKIPGRSSKNKR